MERNGPRILALSGLFFLVGIYATLLSAFLPLTGIKVRDTSPPLIFWPRSNTGMYLGVGCSSAG